MLSTLLASLWMKVAAGTVAAAVATGGLAAADVLPAPAQDAIASVIDKIGVHVPSSDDESDAADDVDGPAGPAGPAEEPNGKSVADDVHAVLDDDSLEGRDKGAAVADAADQNRQDGESAQRPDVQTPAGNASELGPDNHPTGNPTGFGKN